MATRFSGLSLLVFLLAAIPSQAEPTIVINNGFPGVPPAPSTTESKDATPAATMACAPASSEHNEKENGLRLSLGVGLSQLENSSKESLDLIAGVAYHFVDYLGIELRGASSVASGRSRERAEQSMVAGFFKTQIPFKSRWIDFTPHLGVGYGTHRIDTASFTGLQYVLGGEMEFFHTVRFWAEYGQNLGGEDKKAPVDPVLTRNACGNGDRQCFGDSPGYPYDSPNYPDNPPNAVGSSGKKYEHALIGVGFRAGARATLGLEYGVSKVGGLGATTSALRFDFQF